MKIRFQLLLTATLLAASINQINAEEILDKGFDILKIDAKIQTLRPFLIETAPEELWNLTETTVGEYVTSAYLFDFKKAGLINYHGLIITRIEVYFNDDDMDEGKTESQDIFNFEIYLEKPKDEKVESDCVGAHFDLYGDAMIMIDEENSDNIRFTWFSSITMLDLILGFHPETGEKMDYYIAYFHQAYGG